MFPSIEPSEVGLTGLIWLFFSYGYVLFSASNLISEGSDLLLLVPSLAGLVGGVVLPLLGAVPDGAIMLFSGMGDIETAQETLSVGVGALAGSTIMLLTIPWGLSVYGGRVNLEVSPSNGQLKPTYNTKPKLTEGLSLATQGKTTGVVITDEIKNGSKIMLMTVIPYIIIQGPACFLRKGANVASAEKYYALLGLIVCLVFFVLYLLMQVKKSKEDEEKFHRMEVVKNLLKSGEVSFRGAFNGIIKTFDTVTESNGEGYQSVEVSIAESGRPSSAVEEYLSEVLRVPFQKYDKNKNEQLEKIEVRLFLSDFNEHLTDDEVNALFQKYDTDGDGSLSYQEFVWACYSILTMARQIDTPALISSPSNTLESKFAKSAKNIASEDAGEEEEEEEMSPDIAALPPEEQEAAIKKKAFTMLAIGTFLVLLFSDPMVDVMQEIAVRMGISPFYVSFILAPLASNASEVIASMYYASKKTTKTITVSFSALQGAACMNNTFCLSIFMGLIYFRGLAWQFTAETIAIIAVQVAIYFLTQDDLMTLNTGFLILGIFPLSIALVAILEAIGLD